MLKKKLRNYKLPVGYLFHNISEAGEKPILINIESWFARTGWEFQSLGSVDFGEYAELSNEPISNNTTTTSNDDTKETSEDLIEQEDEFEDWNEATSNPSTNEVEQFLIDAIMEDFYVLNNSLVCRTDGDIQMMGTIEENGYRYEVIAGQRLLCCHLLWLLAKGELPNSPLLHINGDTSDDRIENLKQVSLSELLESSKSKSIIGDMWTEVTELSENIWFLKVFNININGFSFDLGIGLFKYAEEAVASIYSALKAIEGISLSEIGIKLTDTAMEGIVADIRVIANKSNELFISINSIPESSYQISPFNYYTSQWGLDQKEFSTSYHLFAIEAVIYFVRIMMADMGEYEERIGEELFSALRMLQRTFRYANPDTLSADVIGIIGSVVEEIINDLETVEDTEPLTQRYYGGETKLQEETDKSNPDFEQLKHTFH